MWRVWESCPVGRFGAVGVAANEEPRDVSFIVDAAVAHAGPITRGDEDIRAALAVCDDWRKCRNGMPVGHAEPFLPDGVACAVAARLR